MSAWATSSRRMLNVTSQLRNVNNNLQLEIKKLHTDTLCTCEMWREASESERAAEPGAEVGQHRIMSTVLSSVKSMAESPGKSRLSGYL